jgi:hypothetical protein
VTADADDDDLIFEALKEAATALRQGGGFRFSAESYRQIEEREDARDALQAAQLNFERLVHHGKGEDPPDCEAVVDGDRWGIELTELLHQASLEQRVNGDGSAHHEWTREDFLAALRERIGRKDDPSTIKGGPYQRYLLIIRTNEMYLWRERIQEFLAGEEFECARITDAYIALDYNPALRDYPVIPVPIKAIKSEVGL